MNVFKRDSKVLDKNVVCKSLEGKTRCWSEYYEEKVNEAVRLSTR